MTAHRSTLFTLAQSSHSAVRKTSEYFLQVGVGMIITNHPLHRSGRALLTHPAPASGNDAESPQWIRVMEARPGQPVVKQTAHPLPSKPFPLAASPQRAIPMTADVEAKRVQRLQVCRHAV